MGTFATILTGVTVYVLGQIIIKMILEPIHEAKKVISEVQVGILRDGHIIHNAATYEKEAVDTVFDNFRLLSSKLIASIQAIPFYGFLHKRFGLPEKQNVYDASVNLIALSNWMTSKSEYQLGYIFQNYNQLTDRLDLYVHPGSKISEELVQELIEVHRA